MNPTCFYDEATTPEEVYDYLGTALYGGGESDPEQVEAVFALGGTPLLQLAETVVLDILSRVYISSDHPALDDQIATWVDPISSMGTIRVRMDDGRVYFADVGQDEFTPMETGAGTLAHIWIHEQEDARKVWEVSMAQARSGGYFHA